MTVHGITTIGLIGAGNIGAQIARLGVAHGYRVVVSSRHPESLAGLVDELGEQASAGTAQQAAEQGDVVVVTIPLHQIDTVPVEPLAGKIVLDTNNYYPQRDGRIAALDAETATTAGLLQDRLAESKVVKAFNHIASADLTTAGSAPGTAHRRALAIYGDDGAANATVAALIDEFGFDVVDGGPLVDSWRIQRDTPGYVQPDDAAGLRAHLAEAVRPAAS